MISGCSVQISAFWPLASRCLLLAVNRLSVNVDPSPARPADVGLRYELDSGSNPRFEDDRIAHEVHARGQKQEACSLTPKIKRIS